MNPITRLFSEEMIQALGWTMVHSLWQGMGVSLLLMAALAAMRRRSPQVRYLAGLSGLALLLGVAFFTFFYLYRDALFPEAAAALEEGAFREALNGAPGAGAIPASGPGTSDGNWWSKLAGQLSQLGQPYFPLLVSGWFFGVCILTLRLFGELALIRQLRYNRSHPASREWQRRMEELARRLGLTRPVMLRESLRLDSPLVIGILRPVILLPAGLVAGLSPAQVESILAHELAHIRRFDYLVNLLQSLAETLLFFNPAVWWISSQIRIEREYCCDDIAVGLTGDAVTFVKTLAGLEEYRQQHAGLAIGFAGARGSLFGRVQRLLHQERPVKLPFRAFWSAAIILIFLAAAAFNWPQARPGEITRLGQDSVAVAPATDVSEVPSPATALPGKPPRSITQDTVPQKDNDYKKEMARLEQEHQARVLELEKQINELHKQQVRLETAAQVQQQEREKQMLERERQFQEMQNQRELENKERQIAVNRVRAMILENEAELEKLEQQLIRDSDKENPNQAKLRELEEKAVKLQEERRALEKKAHAGELQGQTEMLELEKEMQLFNNDRMMAEKDSQIEFHQKQMQALEWQRQAQELQLQIEELNHEFQVRMLDLQRRHIKN